MSEKNKENKEEPTEDNTGGDNEKTVSELDRADSIVERQKRENDRREELLIREEQLQARKMVGGETEAGSKQEPPKEETPQEYAKKIMGGKL